MTFEYPDSDGETFHASPLPGVPAILLRTSPNGAAVPADRVEEVVAGIRDTARTATVGQGNCTHGIPAAPASCLYCWEANQPNGVPTERAQIPSELLRNTILGRAIAGSESLLDELLSRAARTASGQQPAVARPVERRPRRAMSADGPEIVVTTDTTRLVLRQVGWLGQTGAFYDLDEKPFGDGHERGGVAPLYFPAHSDRLDDLTPDEDDSETHVHRLGNSDDDGLMDDWDNCLDPNCPGPSIQEREAALARRTIVAPAVGQPAEAHATEARPSRVQWPVEVDDASRTHQLILNCLTGRAVCGVPRPVDEATGLLDAFRAAVLREAADLVRAGAEAGDFNAPEYGSHENVLEVADMLAQKAEEASR
ncbi:hypothetical protein [Nonomuraea sp. NPDC001636]|uniref:hypothetical protein n=1 Tax=Actinomycetes TaxID=1760 RepID=UPI00332F4DA7